MNLRNVGTDKWLIGVDSTIPDFWTIMFDQYGDFPMPVSVANNVGKKTIIPMNTSIRFHPRTAVHVENFFLHP